MWEVTAYMTMYNLIVEQKRDDDHIHAGGARNFDEPGQTYKF
jgi:hypothetical protein